MHEKAHKYKEKREPSCLSRFPIFMETVGLEHNYSPLFKPIVGSLVAFWLHAVAPAQIKRTPRIFSPGFSYVKNMCMQ